MGLWQCLTNVLLRSPLECEGLLVQGMAGLLALLGPETIPLNLKSLSAAKKGSNGQLCTGNAIGSLPQRNASGIDLRR